MPGALAAAILAPLGAAFIYAMPAGGGAGFEGALARHLREKGAVMYGAHWCPHCSEQKALFGDAAKDVPYVECAADTVNGRPDLCEKAGVKVLPDLGDGHRAPHRRAVAQRAVRLLQVRARSGEAHQITLSPQGRGQGEGWSPSSAQCAPGAGRARARLRNTASGMQQSASTVISRKLSTKASSVACATSVL